MKKIPLTSTMCGASPGAWVVDMTVRAETCATPLTVAAQIHGPPNMAPNVLMKHKSTMSQCKPPPFFLVFSNMISLQNKKQEILQQTLFAQSILNMCLYSIGHILMNLLANFSLNE